MKNLDYNGALEVLGTTLKDGGYSFDGYNEGYMVFLEGTERKACLYGNTAIGALYKIIEFHAACGTVSARLDGSTLYLGEAVNVQDLNEALEFAKETRQRAIYDCKENKVIEL